MLGGLVGGWDELRSQRGGGPTRSGCVVGGWMDQNRGKDGGSCGKPSNFSSEDPF